MIRILTIVGARPQIIKAAAIARAMNAFREDIEELILHTGQHYDSAMSGVFFNEMGVPEPSINLNVGSGSHGMQTARMIEGIEKAILNVKPDIVLIYGDTNSTLAGALAAVKHHVPVAHVEAGIRSYNKSMPEEINRITADHCSTLLFCPTTTAIENLDQEGIRPGTRPWSIDAPGVIHCGDVMYDNTLHFSAIAEQRSDILDRLDIGKGDFHLVTLHRDHNADHPEVLRSVLETLGSITEADGKAMVLPIHPRTLKNALNMDPGFLIHLSQEYPLLKIIDPVPFFDMSVLEKHCSMVFTDSGGVQKEAYFFKRPVIILRNETEWVEIVKEGAGILTGTDVDEIRSAHQRFSDEPPTDFPGHFGDGQAAKHILEEIISHFP